MFYLCLFIFSVCPLGYSNYERTLMKYFGGVKHGLRNNQLDLGSNADRDPVPWFLNDSDPEFFKRLYLLL